MLPRLATRILRTVDKRCLWKFAWNFGVKGMLSVERFKRRIKRGEYFPPFLYLSIINSCNLRCQGCWVDVEADETCHRSRDAQPHDQRRQGARERVLRHSSAASRSCTRSCSTCSRRIPDCYFQVFTNGQFITEKVAKRLRADRQRHAARQHRGPRDHERRAARQQGRLQSHVARAGPMFEGWPPHRRRDERVPVEHRRPAHRSRGCANSSRAASTTFGSTPIGPSVRRRISISRCARAARARRASSSSRCARRCPSPSSTPTTTTMARRSAR